MKKTSTRLNVMEIVESVGAHGITAAEIEALPAFASTTYHGPVSGHLSHLHREGSIARLSEKRECFLNGRKRNFKIYVLPANVNGRETEVQGR